MTPELAPHDLTLLADRLRSSGIVFAEEEAVVLARGARDPEDLATLIARRCAGEPLEHVVGWAEFCGRRIGVTRGVFVPRRRSELLARRAMEVARPGAVVVELCCGAAAIATVLAAEVPDLAVHAVDIEPAAVRCARSNLGAAGHVWEGDLFAPLPADLRGGVDVVVANAPYVPAAEIALLPREARLHEPLVTLDGGADGLEVQRRIAEGARDWLAPGGHLLIETGRHLRAATASVLGAAGFDVVVVTDDDLEATVAIGTLSAR